MELVGLSPRQGLPNILGFWIGNIIRGMILVALLAFLLSKAARKDFKIENDYAAIGIFAIGIVCSFIIFPYLETVYNLDRIYLTLLVFQLPFIAVGINSLFVPIRKLGPQKVKALTFILTILIAAQIVYSTGLLQRAR